MTSNTYTLYDYNIITSFSETCVYIKIVNNISFQCFEDYIEFTDLRLPFNNNQIYDILSRCFSGDDENFKVIFVLNKVVLNLEFYILFNGGFNINFNLLLKEEIMHSDSMMTLKFHKLEIEYNRKFEEQEERIKNLEYIIECLSNIEQYLYLSKDSFGNMNINGKKFNSLELVLYNDNNNTTVNTNHNTFTVDGVSKNKFGEKPNNNMFTLSTTSQSNFGEKPNLGLFQQSETSVFQTYEAREFQPYSNIYTKIRNFYQLNKLTIGPMYKYSNIVFSNKTLRILCIKTPHVNELSGMDGLPSLEELYIECDKLNNADNIIPYIHKNIRKICFLNNTCTLTKEKLIPYCYTNNIELLYY